MGNKFSNIKERALQVAKYHGVSYETFAENIGMTYGSFKGNAKLSPLNSDAIENILAKYPSISADWLVLGQGPMLRNEQPAPMGAPPTVIYERDPRDVELITMQRDMISTQNELIAALKRERGSDPSGFSARAVGFTPPPSTPQSRK